MKIRNLFLLASAACLMVVMVGCSTPARHTKDLKLGMTPDEVLDVMGTPYTVRGSKAYEGEKWGEVWEYIPSVFSAAVFADRYDKTFWIFFENDRLVQWGEPLDFSGETRRQTGATVIEYKEQKEE